MEPEKRIIGLDLSRALAILGMVLVNYKISMNAEGNGPEWLIFASSLLEGRASAVFVLLAGLGLSLMTKKVRVQDAPAKEYRTLIWRRSVFLFVLGMGLYLLQWSADILHYYAFYLFVASFFIMSSSKKLLAAALAIVLTSTVLQLLLKYEYGWDETFQYYETFWTIKGFISHLFFNGYHPVFPWVSFVLMGMWLGRLDLQNNKLRKKLLIVSFLSFLVVEVLSYFLINRAASVVGFEVAAYLFDTEPMPPTVFYMVSSASTAIIIILLCIHITEKFKGNPVIHALVHTGQLALSIYVGHFVVLAAFVMFGGSAENTLPFTTIFSVTFFLLSIILSSRWRNKFKRGPIELLMRKISG